MISLNEFLGVFAMNTPMKVTTESDDIIVYGQRYDGADHDNSFKVFSLPELFNKFGTYNVIYSSIRDGILYVDIADGRVDI